MCGENYSPIVFARPFAGSSPRVRGKLARLAAQYDARRLIPACAGKTATKQSPSSSERAHPRVCGENSIAIETLSPVIGSSPRVRGKQEGTNQMTQSTGLIPACAGKTIRGSRRRGDGPAHPRVCGENQTHAVSLNRITGSSPRVRGKREISRRSILVCGLIPACAGKTTGEQRGCAGERAHPRVCGENCA